MTKYINFGGKVITLKKSFIAMVPACHVCDKEGNVDLHIDVLDFCWVDTDVENVRVFTRQVEMS